MASAWDRKRKEHKEKVLRQKVARADRLSKIKDLLLNSVPYGVDNPDEPRKRVKSGSNIIGWAISPTGELVRVAE